MTTVSHLVESRPFALVFRIAVAAVAALRLLAVLHWLPSDQYGLVAVVESAALLISAVASGGVADALLREAAVRPDGPAFRDLAARGMKALLALAILASVVLIGYLLVFNLAAYRSLLPLFVAAYCATILGEKLGNGLIAILRGRGSLKDYYLTSTAALFVRTGAVLTGVALGGLQGYLVAVLLSEAAVLALLGGYALLHQGLRKAFTAQASHVDVEQRSLLRLSLGAYTIKLAAELWRRGPLLILGAAFPPAAYGFLAAALQLSSRVQLVNKALNPIIIPAAGRAYNAGPEEYLKVARREFSWGFAYNAGVVLAAMAAWHAVGRLIVGADKWAGISQFIYLALAAELIVSSITLANSIVSLQSRAALRHGVVSLVLQGAVLGALAAAIARYAPAHAVSLMLPVMIAVELMLAAYLALACWRIVRQMPTLTAPAASAPPLEPL